MSERREPDAAKMVADLEEKLVPIMTGLAMMSKTGSDSEREVITQAYWAIQTSREAMARALRSYRVDPVTNGLPDIENLRRAVAAAGRLAAALQKSKPERILVLAERVATEAGLCGPRVENKSSKKATSPPSETPSAIGGPAPRHIQARVFPDDEARSEAPFPVRVPRDVAYTMEVRIADRNVVAEWSRETFEPNRSRGAPLQVTVVFVESELASTPQAVQVALPSVGPSQVARFRLGDRGGMASVVGRVAVLHGNRVLQIASLSVPFMADSRFAFSSGRVVVEPTAFPDVSVADRDPLDCALILDRNPAAPRATAIRGQEVSLIDFGNIEAHVAKLAARLSKVAVRPEDYATLDAPLVSDLFNTLAYHGSSLFKALMRRLDDSMKQTLLEARSIQVVSAQEGALLPLEFAYSRRAPLPRAPLCPNARNALESSSCSLSCPTGERQDEVVCPLGFWGLNRVIERQVVGVGHARARFGIRLCPDVRQRLEVFRGALFAASSRVDSADAGTTAMVCGALAVATAGRSRVVSSWAEWVAGIKAASPSLLVLVAHRVHVRWRATVALEIGQSDSLHLGNIESEHVRADKRTAPIVLLIGCETMSSDVEFDSFPVQFQEGGAAIVLGTIATVLGRHAGPVTARLVTTLAELTEKGEVTFGEALLAAKQRLVAEGQVMALCLCAHGDAGWILGKPLEVKQ